MATTDGLGMPSAETVARRLLKDFVAKAKAAHYADLIAEKAWTPLMKQRYIEAAAILRCRGRGGRV